MDAELGDFPVPVNEVSRLAALSALELVGSLPEPAFDSVVALACDTFDVPMATISLVDEHQQWFKASKGVDFPATRRDIAFCNHVIASGEALVVNDASRDARFSRNPLVTGAPHIRFYAGLPLAVEPGINLGALCLVDTKPRRFSKRDAGRLSRMADIVTALLRQHQDVRAMARTSVDLEEQSRTNRRLTKCLDRQERLIGRASALTKIGAWDWDLQTDELIWTDGMYDLHEVPRGTPMNWEQVKSYYVREAREELERRFAESMREGRGFSFEGQITTPKGNRRWVRLSVDVECENGVVVRRHGIKQDITEQKLLLNRMHFLAECDPLTGLWNRSILHEQLRRLQVGADGALGPAALLLVDVDGFKHINDRFGHPVGDECLKQIANRLRRMCGEGDLVARLGGDEFALLLGAPDRQEQIRELSGLLLEEMRRPILWRGQSFQLSGSVGIAVSRHGRSRTSTQLFMEADLALYAAKEAGRNTFRVFVPEMKRTADARFQTIRNIAKALGRNQLELFYQPKINLVDRSLLGFEALLRWRRPDGQVIAAGAFTAAFEDPELSGQIGQWVTQAALGQARAWHEEGLEFGHIAINLSSSQLRQPNFAKQLVGDIATHGLRPGMIEVEVTEGVILNQIGTADLRTTLDALRRAGIRIALDDFGTGYASLTHLRTFSVDVIKVDRSFVQHLMTSPRDHAILESTLSLARQLHLDVVAEGIEDPKQCQFLKTLGCRYGQGYLFSKPVPASEAARWCLPNVLRNNVAC